MTTPAKLSRTDRLLGGIERAGNKLPHPFILFVILFGVVAVVSTAMAVGGAQVTVPGADEVTRVRGLFTGEGLTWFSTSLVDNFVSFPPLGTVLTIMLAVGLAERTGLLTAAVRALFGRAPRWALPYAVGFVGVSGSIMSDSAFIVIPPLAALVFAAAGRHPVAGLIGGFAAAGAGYSTSPFVTSLDALFAGITTAVTEGLPNAGTTVTPVSNYFFNLASSVVLSLLAGLLIARVLEPRLDRIGVPRVPAADPDDDQAAGQAPQPTAELSAAERRGLRLAGLATLGTAVLVVVAVTLPGSPWRAEDGGYLPESPLLDSTVAIVFLLFVVPALVHGVVVREIRTPSDLPALLVRAVRDFAPFIVLAFMLGQFIALFSWSGIGSWLAVRGADLLTAIGFTGFGAILAFILLAALLNLLIVSGSSMWTLLAAVFVPLFVLLGYEPGFVQAAFRIGDSATQVMTPLNPYMIVLLGYLRRYEPEAGLGTVMARMVPFAVSFLVVWMLILAVFYGFGIPFGPGTGSRIGSG